MDKIVVIGSPAAGKTTFARRLGDLLHIKVIHLDRYFWEPCWKEKPREVRKSIQHDLLLREDKWIIEGTYLDSSDERLKAADTIIFLDMPRLLCLWHAVKRRIEYHKQPRLDLPLGCREKLRIPYILKVLVFPHRGRKRYFQKKEEIEKRQLYQKNKTQFYWLKSNEDIKDFFERRVDPQTVQLAPRENRQKHTLFPKVASTVAILGYLGFGVGTINSSLPFAILHPFTLLKRLIQRYHSNEVR